MNASQQLSRQTAQQGFSLVLALSLISLLSIMLITYSLITVNNARTSGASSNSSSGFYAAEAALNARADRVRSLFKGFRTPAGTPPNSVDACKGANQGTDDMRCEEITIAGRKVNSYVWRSGEPYAITVAAGERFAGLVGEETPFTVRSQALNAAGNPEALANLTFRSRVIPLFQFAVFFDKDMEFDNTAKLEFTGPIHSNRNIFLDSGAGNDTSLTLRGQVTAAYDIFRRQKRDAVCQGVVRIAALNTSLVELPCSGSLNTAYNKDYYKNRYNGTVEPTIGELEVPSIQELQPSPSAEYWQKADVRIVLKKTSATMWTPQFVSATGIQLNPSNCIDPTINPYETLPTDLGVSTNAAVTYTQTFRDTREARHWEALQSNNPRSAKTMLEIDVRRLLTCIDTPANNLLLGVSGGLQNTTEGGLVVFMTFDDRGGSTVANGLLSLAPNANGGIAQGDVANNYGVRLRNGAQVKSLGGVKPKGVTFVTDQAAYIEGDFNSADSNSNDWVPTAVLADSMNVLSDNWKNSIPAGKYLAAASAGYPSTEGHFWTGSAWATKPCVDGAESPGQSNGTNRTLFYETIPLRTSPTQVEWFCLYSDATMNARFGNSRPPNRTNALSVATNITNTYLLTGDGKSQLGLLSRLANAQTGNTEKTIINTAILAGTATTGQEGQLYYNNTAQSGGVHNMMRFHEEWGANAGHPGGTQTYQYRGSLVSLDKPQHAVGSFQVGEPTYNPPLRVWSFEENFRQVAKLPPLTPRFVYIKQDNFTRDFAQ